MLKSQLWIILIICYHLEQQCTPGNYIETQYDENQTPTLEDCDAIYRCENGCTGFAYGTQSGYIADVVNGTSGSWTSDGHRANDCIINHSNPSLIVDGMHLEDGIRILSFDSFRSNFQL